MTLGHSSRIAANGEVIHRPAPSTVTRPDAIRQCDASTKGTAARALHDEVTGAPFASSAAAVQAALRRGTCTASPSDHGNTIGAYIRSGHDVERIHQQHARRLALTSCRRTVVSRFKPLGARPLYRNRATGTPPASRRYGARYGRASPRAGSRPTTTNRADAAGALPPRRESRLAHAEFDDVPGF